MKILFVTTRLPYPPNKGDKVRSNYPIKYLSKNHSIDLLSFTDEEIFSNDLDVVKKYCNKICIVKISKLSFYLKLGMAIFSPVPSQVFCYYSREMSQTLKEYCRKNSYDIVHFVNGRIAFYGDKVNNIPSLLDWIDALSLSTKRMYQTERFFPKKLLYWWEWKKMEAFEKKHARTCSYSIVTSQIDKDVIGQKDVEVISNGVDSDRFKPADEIKKDIDLIFTGNMGYFPNIQAVEYFCEEIFPQIQKKRPKTNFYIAGINPSASVLKLGSREGICVVGFVDDMVKYLNRAHVFVAPMRSGAGIQNKILEAMSCAMPVVTSAFGNGAIQGKDNVDLFECNDSNRFSEAVLELLDNPEKRNATGYSAREFVIKNFSWEYMIQRLENIYNNLNRKGKCQ